MKPGEYVLREEPVTCNEGSDAISLTVINRGDRPVQVGSHYHFAEVNDALEFDRETARGRRLDIPAGTAVRFEPGDAKTVNLIELAGTREVYGFRDRVNGPLDAGKPDGGPARPGAAQAPATHATGTETAKDGQ